MSLSLKTLFRTTPTITHTVQLTSFGGTGTTMLYRVLEAHGLDLPPNAPKYRPWKHLRVPPEDDAVPAGFRVAYLFGNPMNAVLSVFRRDYQRWHVRNMRDDLTGWDDDWTVEAFLAQERDHFAMAPHFHRWTRAERAYPILLLHFDALWDHLPEVAAFFGLPTRALDDFPAKRPRHSDWTDEPPAVQAHLRRLYGDLHAEIEALPRLSII
jgi:hypothetical protein